MDLAYPCVRCNAGALGFWHGSHACKLGPWRTVTAPDCGVVVGQKLGWVKPARRVVLQYI
ncbi:hypothetical protein [Acetobacter ascendens]|uniref:hypothetical protein n=1 Tax=Acetobacter ascendens TaxID=481146 RepID=UPI0003708B32|nr:hypothetical protein [Acetobacter ascendens]AOW48222.1 hypothetical protein A4R89_00985 [Acetobacter ascendens]